LFHEADIYGAGQPTRIANDERDVREGDAQLPVSEIIAEKLYSIPWFKHYRPQVIEQYANAFQKVSANYKDLLAGDKGNPELLGGWNMFKRKK